MGTAAETTAEVVEEGRDLGGGTGMDPVGTLDAAERVCGARCDRLPFLFSLPGCDADSEGVTVVTVEGAEGREDAGAGVVADDILTCVVLLQNLKALS
jgi:hypothetical protein